MSEHPMTTIVKGVISKLGKDVCMTTGLFTYLMIKEAMAQGSSVSRSSMVWMRCYEKYGDYFWAREDCDKIMIVEEELL